MIEVLCVDYHEKRNSIRDIRLKVFVEEQGVPPEKEMDDLDEDCLHALAVGHGQALGTGRLTPDGHIGRVAVLKEFRGQGIGKLIMAALMKEAQQRGFSKVVISSQWQVISFYETLGFTREGDPFMEAGIKHLKMVALL